MGRMILLELGNNLKKYRDKAGITQEQLAEIVGIHPTYVGKLEAGKNNPSMELLYKISRAVNVKLFNLFDFDK